MRAPICARYYIVFDNVLLLLITRSQFNSILSNLGLATETIFPVHFVPIRVNMNGYYFSLDLIKSIYRLRCVVSCINANWGSNKLVLIFIGYDFLTLICLIEGDWVLKQAFLQSKLLIDRLWLAACYGLKFSLKSIHCLVFGSSLYWAKCRMRGVFNPVPFRLFTGWRSISRLTSQNIMVSS